MTAENIDNRAPLDTTRECPHRPILWGNLAFLTLTPLAAVIAVPWYAITHGITWVRRRHLPEQRHPLGRGPPFPPPQRGHRRRPL